MSPQNSVYYFEKNDGTSWILVHTALPTHCITLAGVITLMVYDKHHFKTDILFKSMTHVNSLKIIFIKCFITNCTGIKMLLLK